jgi:hypothetical protein
MIRSRYVADSAGWMFLTGSSLCIGVAIPDDSPLLAELWKLVDSAADASAVLDALTRGGISSAPDFAIVTPGPEGKVLVRGAATVVVDGSEHASLSGAGFSSWAERTIDRIDRFSCEVTSSSGAVRLPLLGGAVRSGWFAADTAGDDDFASGVGGPAVDSVAAVAVTASAAPLTPPAASPTSTEPAPSALSEVTVVAIDEVDNEESGVAGAPEPTEEPIRPPSGVDEGGKPTAYDFLFGDTSYRTVEEAAVRPPSVDESDSESVSGVEDRTVVASDLAQLRAKRRAGRGRTVADAPAASFYLELSTGGQERLDQPLVIGRAPSATALGGDRLPRLVTMTTPNQDISRTHAQISVEGGTVVVTDLHSSNGTIVVLPGRSAQKLREGEATPVIPGTVIDLGDGATLTVRET